MKISESIKSTTQLGEGGVGVNSDNRAGHDSKCKLSRSKIGGVEVDESKVGDNEVGKKDQKTFKFKKLSKSKKTIGSDFFTTRARLAFTKLRQVFVKAPILYYFDLKHYI